MNLFIKNILIVVFINALSATCYSQEQADTLLFKIETQDGNTFIGNKIAEDENTITLMTENYGKLEIKKVHIKSIQPIENESVKDGQYWGENVQDARYFWAPNGYGLQKGEGYYQNIMVFFNQVSIGVTDYFSLGVGVMPTFLFGTEEIPIWVVPKFSIPVVEDKFNLGVGMLAGTITFTGESLYLPFVSSTFGGRNKNLSFGYGYGKFSNTGISMFNLNFMSRISRRSFFLTENYIITDSGNAEGLLMAGFRTNFSSLSLDYGLVIPVVDSFIAIPWLGIVIPFNN